MNFKGCLIIVSHDRYFMDKVVDQIFAFEGMGCIKNFPGNYTIYRDTIEEEEKELKKIEKPSKPKKEKPKTDNSLKKLSFNEKREYEQLEIDLEDLNREKEQIETEMSSGSLSNDELLQKANRIETVINLIDEKELRWLELSERV
jgi:ATP-binding cassette subfamily F protein uup